MRLSLLLLISLPTTLYAYKNHLKTKKYKCIEVNEDEEEIQIRPKTYGWDKEDEELRPIGSARLGPPPTSAPVEHHTPNPVTSNFISPMEPPRDKHGNPLILSPQHCAQVKHYASMYGVRDVLTWVKGNCAFAKMYLPQATCDEINILVASCYPSEHRRRPPPPRSTSPPSTTVRAPIMRSVPSYSHQSATTQSPLFGAFPQLQSWLRW